MNRYKTIETSYSYLCKAMSALMDSEPTVEKKRLFMSLRKSRAKFEDFLRKKANEAVA